MTEEVGPRQRAAETKRKRTREQIIMAVLDLYAELDQGDFTRDQLAEAAGVGVATIHNHFRTKYEVLRAVYEELISPITEPIKATSEAGTYNPPDAVAELIRYLYEVAKASHEHRALTVAMVRAYFETTPEYRPEMHDWRTYQQLGGAIAAGMMPIVAGRPFDSGNALIFGSNYTSGVQFDTMLYHSNALLLNLYHSPGSFVRSVLLNTLKQLLPVILPGFKPSSELADKITQVIEKRP